MWIAIHFFYNWSSTAQDAFCHAGSEVKAGGANARVVSIPYASRMVLAEAVDPSTEQKHQKAEDERYACLKWAAF